MLLAYLPYTKILKEVLQMTGNDNRLGNLNPWEKNEEQQKW